MINEILLQQARRELDALINDPSIRYQLIGDCLMALENKEKQAAYVERMKDAGFKRVHVWLSPESQKIIEKIQTKHGLKRDDAIEFLIQK